MQTQITPRRVIEEETEELGEKPLQVPTPTRLLRTVSCLALWILQQAPGCIRHP